MIVSMPLEWQAARTTNNLMFACDTSEQTHRVYEYSQVLQNIRASKECAPKFSVEECAGYKEAPPFTSYLKSLENTFRCAGFCYKPSSKSEPASSLDAGSQLRQQHAEASVSDTSASLTYPPTLFSDANYQASCEGMASRDMENF